MPEQGPILHGLERQLAVLEERMNTKHQEYKTDIANLATDAAKRETRQFLVNAGLFTTLLAIGLTILGLVLTGSSS